jgi:hypothetical protein
MARPAPRNTSSLTYSDQPFMSPRLRTLFAGCSNIWAPPEALPSEGELSVPSTGKGIASGRLMTHTYSVTGWEHASTSPPGDSSPPLTPSKVATPTRIRIPSIPSTNKI